MIPQAISFPHYTHDWYTVDAGKGPRPFTNLCSLCAETRPEKTKWTIEKLMEAQQVTDSPTTSDIHRYPYPVSPEAMATIAELLKLL